MRIIIKPTLDHLTVQPPSPITGLGPFVGIPLRRMRVYGADGRGGRIVVGPGAATKEVVAGEDVGAVNGAGKEAAAADVARGGGG